jgi:ComF family protein
MHLLRCFLDLLLPSSCAYCSSPLGDSTVPFFCSACWSDFSVLPGPFCPSCGKPFDSSEALTHSPAHECHACRLEPPRFDQALSVGYFEGSLREAVHQFKYRPCPALGKPLGVWMCGNLRVLTSIDIIMPVPLHRSRLRQRGFNQALLLARQLSTAGNIPLCYDNLWRIRPTRPQVELSGKDRVRNVAGAFALRRPPDVSGLSVLIVDDVFTTGATLNECADVLKNAGAVSVIALTLARAV